MSQQEKFVGIELVAEHFDVSLSTVRSWVRKEKLPQNSYFQISGVLRFKLSLLEEGLLGIKENRNNDHE